jgi:acyl dehydratase
MAKSEQDKLIEEWLAETNRQIGEISSPPVGEYPPDPNHFYGSIMNEWVTTDLIRHFADGMGDRNPLWRNENYARRTRWGGIIAPPTISDTIIQPYSGKFDTSEIAKKFKTIFAIPNGSARQMLQVVRPGDKFRAVQYYLGLREVEPRLPKPSREFDDTMRRILINQRDEVVCIHDRHMLIAVNHELDDDHPYWPKRRKRRLTDEERDSVTNGYDNEKIRGSNTLYWEDVKVGEELKPLIVGPLSVQDICACYSVVNGHAVAFDIEWERIKLNPPFHWLDPEVNAWTCSGICHVCDDKGHAKVWDGGAAVSFYFQVEWLLGRMITNWMGDDGFLKKLDDRFPILPILGEVLVQKGKVTKKYQEGGEYLVDLDIHTENLDGLLMVPGTATVQLPGKNDYKLGSPGQITNKTPVMLDKIIPGISR